MDPRGEGDVVSGARPAAAPSDFERLYADSWSRIVALGWSLTGSPMITNGAAALAEPG